MQIQPAADPIVDRGYGWTPMKGGGGSGLKEGWVQAFSSSATQYGMSLLLTLSGKIFLKAMSCR